jgi:hypothetical protein
MGLRRGETRERNLSWLEWSFPSGLSEDGEFLLITEQGEGGGPHMGLYLRKMDESPAIRLGDGMGLGISHDGKRVLALAGASPAKFSLIPTGPGDPRTLEVEGFSAQFVGEWMPDGKSFLFQGNIPGHGLQLFLQDLSGGKPRAVSGEGGQSTYGNAVTPDGKYVTVGEAGEKVKLYPLGGGEPRVLEGSTPQDSPVRWSSDGRALFVQPLGASPARVDRLDLDTGKRETWKEFIPADASGVLNVGPIFLSADGQSYVYGVRRSLSDLYLVTGLK